MDSKQLVTQFYQEFFNDHDVSAADRYVREDYIQHNPGVEQGREALKAAFAEKFIQHPAFHLTIQRMVAEDDMIWVYLKNVAPDGHTVCRVVDMYRVQDGKLAEHWDVLQPC